jgi:hypothetical protein
MSVDSCRQGLQRQRGEAGVELGDDAKAMNNTASDFVKVDMRGLKAALVALARRRRVSLSRVVRDSVELVIDRGGAASVPVLLAGKSTPRSVEPGLVKVWFRLTPDEVAKLNAMATGSGLSRSAVVGEMLRGAERLVRSSSAAARV